MIKKYFKKIIALTVITTSIISLNSIGISAAWKKDKSGWFYKEGDSYTTGWKHIDNDWYYFDNNGCATRCNMKSIA